MRTVSEAMGTLQTAGRLRQVGVSEILRIAGLAAELRAKGHDVISLGAGEPDFDTPEPIRDAAARAMHQGATKYTALEGTVALKAAVRAKFARDNGLTFDDDEVIACTGAKQVIFNAMMATLNPGDEVIVPVPAWVSYSDIVTITGGRPVSVRCFEEDGFRLRPDALEAAITPLTRWVFLNSPSNPTGAGYTAAHLRPLLDVLLRHPQVWVLADDIYEHIVYDDFRFATPAAVEPALRQRTLTVNGVSKAYAMTGWRIGYGGGPKALIAAMAVVQSQTTSCPSSVSQAAATAALVGPQHLVEERRSAFQDRRDLLVGHLNGIAGLSCLKPEGAFYAFANCAGTIGRITPQGAVIATDQDFSDYLLGEAGVAVVPGSAFGLAPYIRISYAASTGQLEEACHRIAAACARLT